MGLRVARKGLLGRRFVGLRVAWKACEQLGMACEQEGDLWACEQLGRPASG